MLRTPTAPRSWLPFGEIFGDASDRQPKTVRTAEGLAHRPLGRFGNRVPQDQYVDYPIWGYSPSLTPMLPTPPQRLQLDVSEIPSGAISLNARLQFFGYP
jgi:hypothetical protein